MNSDTPILRYGRLSIAMHWLMLLLIVAVYACIELREFYPKGSDIREAFKAWHFTLGLTVLGMVAVRIVIRIGQAIPPITPEPSGWQRLLARIVHITLYLFMICMPIAGWLILSAAGKPIPFFGFGLAPLIQENKDLAGQIKDLHETVGSFGYYLIGLHALAALAHHYLWKDDTLKRMLPGQRRN